MYIYIYVYIDKHDFGHETYLDPSYSSIITIIIHHFS